MVVFDDCMLRFSSSETDQLDSFRQMLVDGGVEKIGQIHQSETNIDDQVHVNMPSQYAEHVFCSQVQFNLQQSLICIL